jgi:hypothetical protein
VTIADPDRAIGSAMRPTIPSKRSAPQNLMQYMSASMQAERRMLQHADAPGLLGDP